ncbi:MAG: MSCRAMM family adhesin SdrC, partial [Proteobacteria bacterium]|nr:MSCRAMM family adhesin SdrC [Pseudomonadota bacterium]
DAFPLDKCATLDNDNDSLPDDIKANCTTILNADTDDDNDGTPDTADAYPLDKCAATNTDDDAQPDDIIPGCETTLSADLDDDNDGFADTDDDFPLDKCAWADIDSDNKPDELVPGCITSLTVDDNVVMVELDSTPPAPVSGVQVNHNLTTVQFRWTDADDEDLHVVLVEWTDSDQQLQQSMVAAGTQTLTLNGLTDNHVYYFNLYSADQAMNLSDAVSARVKITGQRYFPIQLNRWRVMADLHQHDPSVDTDELNDYSYEIISGNYTFADETPGHRLYDSRIVKRFAYGLGFTPYFSPDPNATYANLRVWRPSLFIMNRDVSAEFAAGGRKNNPDGRPSALPEVWSTHWWTFEKTQGDEIGVRMRQKNGVVQNIIVRVSPEPAVLRVNSECDAANIDNRLEDFLCRNAREYLPAGFSRRPSLSDISRLPEDLRRQWGEEAANYEISAEIDFSSSQQTFEEVFDNPIIKLSQNFTDSSDAKGYLDNTALVLPVRESITDIPLNGGVARVRRVDNTAVSFKPQFSSGFFEMAMQEMPFIADEGIGPIYNFWSRFGDYHTNFSIINGPYFSKIWESINQVDCSAGQRLGAGGRPCVHRSELSRLGFLELEFFERWLPRQEEWFAISWLYPSGSRAIAGLNALGKRSSSTVFERAPMPSHTTYAFWIEPDHTDAATGVSFFRRRDTAANSTYTRIGRPLPGYAASWTNVVVNRANFFVAQSSKTDTGNNPHNVIVSRTSTERIKEPLNAKMRAVKIDYIRLWQRRDRDEKTRPAIRYLCTTNGCPPLPALR